MFSCHCAAVEIVQLSPTSVAKRLLLLSVLVGFGDIMNLNATGNLFWPSPSGVASVLKETKTRTLASRRKQKSKVHLFVQKLFLS